ncbi:MAG TPA: hypothetical protein VH592_21145 [Gemmataceae bacterium]|jgi:hypothetical protein
MDSTISPIELIDSLDIDAIRAALDECDRREVALRKLLRVALVQRGTVGRRGPMSKEREAHRD